MKNLLSLKDIGKIYVSDNNVSVGIRGVNLDFNKGEFVAITGKSGSGKSTLLNVISGMDSYEEGELFVEGNPTSHYIQTDWEEYRKKYIAFIFQDYNIIDSFTVLENVELALMNIEDLKERRKKALELIERVGLKSHINHKGSKLSGGQKQRTVIARALAKNSPIILADEPTGNLDSTSSKEIIELLHEVSKDKLLIIVTHSFDEVKDYATREIRVYDGTIEFDHKLKEANEVYCTEEQEVQSTKKHPEFTDGLLLGKAIFKSKPKLSIFLCLLMIVSLIAIFAITSSTASSLNIFKKNYMFEHINGRVILANNSGDIITDDDLAYIKTKVNYDHAMHYDYLLDQAYTIYDDNYLYYISAKFTYDKNYGNDILGKYPESKDEVFLYIPKYAKKFINQNNIGKYLNIYNVQYKVCGIKYFSNNQEAAYFNFTKEGFEYCSAFCYLYDNYATSYLNALDDNNNVKDSERFYTIIPSFNIESGKLCLALTDFFTKYQYLGYTYEFNLNMNYNKYYYSFEESKAYSKTYDESYIIHEYDFTNDVDDYNYYDNICIISADLIKEFEYEFLSLSYKQASIFFKNDKEAKENIEALQNLGYVVVPSYSTYQPEALETILLTIGAIFEIIIWFVSILFLSFFISLCTNRSINVFRTDVGIMRSMGISKKTIKVGMFVRMLICLIPAYITLAVVAIIIYNIPILNALFDYIYWWEYVLIAVGLLFLIYRITNRQYKKLFKLNVKKSIASGGKNND